MADFPIFNTGDHWILKNRGRKNPIDNSKPYGFSKEHERIISGEIVEAGTVFLTDTTCPFHCLMCDLWKNTSDIPALPGMIPGQIKYALEKLGKLQHIKMYNSGNFFDVKAVPPQDYPEIAGLLTTIKTVIVENHPRLVNENVLKFRDMLNGHLEIAMGLETVHPEVLPRLNKRMLLDDFRKATAFLKANDISVRAFILLRPPFLNEKEGVEWACKSLDFAFESGVDICTVIPTRGGNGSLEVLKEMGYFNPPAIKSLEAVLEYGISLKKGLVFADLWDLRQFSTCEQCYEKRKTRLEKMNLSQKILSPVSCQCN